MNKRLVVVVVSLVGLGFVYLRNRAPFSRPIMGVGDTEQLEWIPFVLTQAIAFVPWPKLQLLQNWVAYPAGTTITYLPYSWESNLAVAALTYVFGPANWSYLYFLTTALALFLLAYFFLRHLFSVNVSSTVAFFVAFTNVYAQNKFPRHAHIAYCHWTSLTLVVVYVFLTTIRQRRLDLSRRLLPFLPVVLALSLGQDLGYLQPFCLTIWFTAFLFLAFSRHHREALSEVVAPAAIRGELAAHKGYVVACLLITGFALFLYVPLSFQVARDALLHPPIDQGSTWANPLRWLIPSFPYLVSPAWDAFKDWLVDVGDTELMGVPGWYALLAAGVGIWQTRTRWALEKAVVFTLLVAVILFHPVWFPTLKLFPWHTYSRNSARYAVVLAPLLALLAIPFFEKWRQQPRWLRGLFLFILLVEGLAQTLPLGQRARGLSPEETTYYSHVRNIPGEAILEWPYCLTAWNETPEGPCVQRPHRFFTSHVQRFHGKKVLSAYLARASSRERAEWATIPLHDLLDTVTEKRCFNDGEWKRFTDFYLAHDFAGLELYPDLLPKDCADQWRKRWGEPVRSLKSPGAPLRLFFVNKSRKP